MKVIASSLRKGNVVDMDGKLYVVLTAENIHPGKGTPVTQIDMRRISDGVKVSERYRTTEQVERAFVEDRDYNFLYQDGEGYHFMNPENYDQLRSSTRTSSGDMAIWLQEGMRCMLSMHRGRAVAHRAARPRHARDHRDRAGDEGPDGFVLLQARHAVQRRRASWCRPHIAAGTRVVMHDGRRLLRGTRQGLSAVP